MRIDVEAPGMRTGVLMSALLVGLAMLIAVASPTHAAESEEAKTANGADWRTWRAHNNVESKDSLQRGARNFFSYCEGCHSLKYLRYSRMAEDLNITPDQLAANLLPPGAKPADYVIARMPADDATVWFGKAPPDLSLMVRARGADYIYQFLKTFYSDPTKPTGANNLRLENTAMPAVLSDLEGLKSAAFKTVDKKGENGQVSESKVFDHFEETVPGKMRPEEFDTFVRDTVNFLDYASEPSQVTRRSLGIWVVLFLLAFTWLTWLLKKEYWKDIH